MNKVTMDKARESAHRFLEAIQAVEERIKIDCNEGSFYGSIETGTLRRISMELTRDLANLRKSG